MSSAIGEIVAVEARQGDRVVIPMFENLADEYSFRYGRSTAEELEGLYRYDSARFSPPDGGLVVLVRGGASVAGGAWQRYDDDTAELKRIWTDPRLRGTGLGRRVIGEVEGRIASAGYRKIYLTTGWRQPEAVRLYVRSGYTPQFDPADYPIGALPHPFRKELSR